MFKKNNIDSNEINESYSELIKRRAKLDATKFELNEQQMNNIFGFQVPSQNQYFVGRQNEIQTIQQYFNTKSTNHEQKQQYYQEQG